MILDTMYIMFLYGRGRRLNLAIAKPWLEVLTALMVIRINSLVDLILITEIIKKFG